MSADVIFNLANMFVLVGWILLFFAPHWKMTQKIVLNGVVLILSFVYLLIFITLAPEFSLDSFSSLEAKPAKD